MAERAIWTVFETSFESRVEPANPWADQAVTVTFTAPSGAEHPVRAFWDGGRSWRVRFAPDEVGAWRWRTAASNVADEGLHGRAGELRCVAYDGDNPLYRHGVLRLSDDRRHLAYADGTPFFWLGDTAWNGVLRAAEADWDR